jgi:hypothetical protein
MVRLTDEELAKIDADRKEAGMSRGGYFRSVALGYAPQIIPAVNREQWVTLSRLMSNLNQSIHLLNGGTPSEIPAATIIAIGEKLQEIRRELLGGER